MARGWFSMRDKEHEDHDAWASNRGRPDDSGLMRGDPALAGTALKLGFRACLPHLNT
eukprot:CAMPEP_0168451000 /NCGR_PEP_ID=MMETSP0228-20121227/48412_1 /TAXON_ID=133427 /ORGANISM="Protoceratium reticulatum, Strain CCCM 535 (=CCMP 1889)" /LENGTH=56 /DNA_ID=CAMNT_0008465607 /DNA_START=97 /DNA_END=264 /DNA_ORIENTATION=-